MITYPFRCQQVQDHYFERRYEWGQYPVEHECVFEGCEGTARRIIGQVHFEPDNMDSVDMSFSLGEGVHFGSRRERNNYLKANGMRIMEEQDVREHIEYLAHQKEAREFLRSQRVDLQEFMHEAKRKKKEASDERLRSLGMKIEKITETDYEDFSQDDESDLTEEMHRGEAIYNKDGKHLGYEGKRPDMPTRMKVKEKYESLVRTKDYSEFTERVV